MAVQALKNQIFVGSLTDPMYYFENDQIFECPTTQAVALVGQELSIDTFSPVVCDSEDNLLDIYRFRSSDGKEIQTGVGQVFAIDTEKSGTSDIINIPDGTPMWYYNNDQLVGKFYIVSVDRLAKNQFRLNGESAMGLLEHKYHGGGLFQGSGVTFASVLQHILASGLHGTGAPVIQYEIDSDVAEISVSGWLPYATKRNNLYQLIFAYGVNIVRNPYTGNPVFTFVYTASSDSQSIEDTEIFYDGDVTYTKPYSAVDVVEHTYTDLREGIEPTVLYDNTEGRQVFSEEIWFDSAPIIVASLATEGNLSLISATENSAVISGNGILTGIPYNHTTRIVTKINPLGASGQVVNVSACTMVNLVNSQNVLNRLYAFYCPTNYIKLIRNSIKYSDQRCGKAYKFHNPYGEEETAFLAYMDAKATSFLRADCEFYAGYEPAGQQGLMPHVDTIVPEPDPENPDQKIIEGDWVVPDGVTEFKVVLMSGGTGGGSGWPGKNGREGDAYTEIEQIADLSSVWYGAEGGDGGKGGAGGSPGRVKIFTIQNAVPGTTYHYKLGLGGEGGASTGFIEDDDSEISPNAGLAGSASTFTDGSTTWSTDDIDSYIPTGGVYDPINAKFYALPGRTGIRGGKGGARKVEYNGSFNWVTDGEDVTGDDGTVYHGGSTGRSMTVVGGLSEARILSYGGNGAGAAVGIDRATHPHINGGNDQSATWEVKEDVDELGGE